MYLLAFTQHIHIPHSLNTTGRCYRLVFLDTISSFLYDYLIGYLSLILFPIILSLFYSYPFPFPWNCFPKGTYFRQFFFSFRVINILHWAVLFGVSLLSCSSFSCSSPIFLLSYLLAYSPSPLPRSPACSCGHMSPSAQFFSYDLTPSVRTVRFLSPVPILVSELVLSAYVV